MEGSRVVQQTERKNALHHLYQAIEVDTPPRKDFHIRQALRLLGVDDLED